MDKYIDLKAWVEAYKLSLSVYKITKNFPKEEMFGIISQVRRASISVVANIAEGKGRFSNREMIRFLLIARGSLLETDVYVSLSKDLGYIGEETYIEIKKQVDLVGKLINGLLKSLRKKLSDKNLAAKG